MAGNREGDTLHVHSILEAACVAGNGWFGPTLCALPLEAACVAGNDSAVQLVANLLLEAACVAGNGWLCLPS